MSEKTPIGGQFDLRQLDMPKPEIKGAGGKVGSALDHSGFFGMIQIMDGRDSREHREFFAGFLCLRCKKTGGQRLVYKKAKFPNGVSDEDLRHAFRERISQNHACGARIIH